MKAHLVFPDHRTATQYGYRRKRTPVTWTEDHPLSLFGLGVLLDEYGDRFEWSWLRSLHNKAGAYLESSDPITALRALGLFAGEHHDLFECIKSLNHGEHSMERTAQHSYIRCRG